jgi:flagellar biosynthesis component FlhA
MVSTSFQHPAGRPDQVAPGDRRRWLVWLLIARTAILLIVAPALGVIALITGHGDAALPIFVVIGLAAVLSLAAWVRRRSSEPHG